MRKSMRLFLGVVFSLSILVGAASAADKIAYVDLSRIFSEYGKTKEYEKGLTNKESIYGAEREKKVNEVKQLQDKMNLLSDKEKEAKKAEFETKIKALQEFDRQKQTDLRKEESEKMKDIFKDIEEAVKQCATKEGYSLVLNDRVLVYQDKSMDITDKVIAIVNSGYKK